jgi:hypothetical protein
MSFPLGRHQVKDHIFTLQAIHPDLGPTAESERDKVLGYGDGLNPRHETISPSANPWTRVCLPSNGIVSGSMHNQAFLVLWGSGTEDGARSRDNRKERKQQKENPASR